MPLLKGARTDKESFSRSVGGLSTNLEITSCPCLRISSDQPRCRQLLHVDSNLNTLSFNLHVAVAHSSFHSRLRSPITAKICGPNSSNDFDALCLDCRCGW